MEPVDTFHRERITWREEPFYVGTPRTNGIKRLARCLTWAVIVMFACLIGLMIFSASGVWRAQANEMKAISLAIRAHQSTQAIAKQYEEFRNAVVAEQEWQEAKGCTSL